MVIKMRLGDLLVESGLITESQLTSALDLQRKSGGKKLGNILVDLGVISEEDMLEVLRKKLNTNIVKLSNVTINEKIIELVPEELAREKNVIAYSVQGTTLFLATSDPLDYETQNQVGAACGKIVEPVIATRNDINDAINRYYNKNTIDTMASAIDSSMQEKEAADALAQINLEEIESRVGSVPVVKFINNLVVQASQKRASDIHIEPMPDFVRVRFRIDGDLVEIVRMNINAHPSIVTRVKIMAGMDIAEKRIPLDGRFDLNINGLDVSVRAASMPTVYGEKVVLRLLSDSRAGVLPLEALGGTASQCAEIRHAMKYPNGLILITGPTGSGKSTTLYSILNELYDESTNILTVEDPVEKMIAGINQTQVNPRAGLTFAAGLRAILRQDPDKIMIGEIRDSETADIAARAAITGHLVVASMHTNSAASAYMRLVDMGIEPYIVASSVVMVAAQRLVKQICPRCIEKYKASAEEKSAFQDFGYKAPETLYRGKGCAYCENTGYFGRVAIMETVLSDSGLRQLIVEKAKVSDITDYLNKSRNQKYLINGIVELVITGKAAFNEIFAFSQSID